MIQFRNPSTGLIETFKGLKGNDGKSAYEYATSMGYPGSEEDFAKLMSYDAKEAIEQLLQDMAGVANIEEVTQAEYDALGNDKFTNGITYFIKDGESDSPSQPETPAIDVDALLVSFCDKIYPIGSIYTSINSTNPETLFGGSWTQINDVFLLAAGSKYSAGSTGGESTHILTTNEMPSHAHGEQARVYGYDGWNSYNIPAYTIAFNYTKTDGAAQYFQNTTTVKAAGVSANIETGKNGGGAAHNNMPPYLTVYMWKRTA